MKMIAIPGMEITDCLHCRLCIKIGTYAWCAAQSEEGIHWIDNEGRGYWEPGWREPTCPLEEVEPIKKGYWVTILEDESLDDDEYMCSVCGNIVDSACKGCQEIADFCPACGA